MILIKAMPRTLSVRLQANVPMPLAKTIQDRANYNRRSVSQEVEWLVVQGLRKEGVEVE